MIENLVIVESPAKAKTIEKFLGKDFRVVSSFGHIRDLKKKNLGIDIANNFTPEYEIPKEKAKVVGELRKAAAESKNIWIASDEDREGEAIAWHLASVLNLDLQTTKRIVFHEITKDAISNAILSPRRVDMNLVNSQQARRILDRLVGFEISPVLWKKVQPALSAGRVQSVAVRLIVEREREVIAFKSESSFRINGYLKVILLIQVRMLSGPRPPKDFLMKRRLQSSLNFAVLQNSASQGSQSNREPGRLLLRLQLPPFSRKPTENLDSRLHRQWQWLKNSMKRERLLT